MLKFKKKKSGAKGLMYLKWFTSRKTGHGLWSGMLIRVDSSIHTLEMSRLQFFVRACFLYFNFRYRRYGKLRFYVPDSLETNCTETLLCNIFCALIMTNL